VGFLEPTLSQIFNLTDAAAAYYTGVTAVFFYFPFNKKIRIEVDDRMRAVGPRGGKMLGLLTLAVHARIPITKIRSMIYAFPTFTGGIGEAIAAYGRGLTTVPDPGYEGLKELDRLIEAIED